MIIIPSKNHDWLNYRAQDVDRRFGRAMVNPHYQSISVCPRAEILVDSGAFQKKDMQNRLTPEQAFKRQRKFEYDRRPPDGRPWRLVSYDCLRGVDEELVQTASGVSRIKTRGSATTAAPAVALTIEAAEYYRKRADDVEGGIAYSAQGATVEQYLACVRALLDLARPEKDWLALGGFCIIGMQRSLLPQFLETLSQVAPLVRAAGLEQIHVLGVAFPDALVPAAAICRRESIRFSTDTAGFELQAINGCEWDERNIGDRTGRRRGSPYRHTYGPEQKWNSISPTPSGHYNPGELLVQNLERVIEWATPL